MAALLPSCQTDGGKRQKSLVLHTACSVQGFPSLRGAGVIEEARHYRLSRRRLQPLNKNCRPPRVWESAMASSLSAACDTRAVQHGGDEGDASVALDSAALFAHPNGQLFLQLRRRRLLASFSADGDQAEDASAPREVRIRWPGGSVDRGDVLTDFQLAGPAREVVLAGRRAVFCLPSVNDLARSAGVKPLCVAASPIVALDAAALPGASRLVAVCSLQEVLVADARSRCVAVRFAAPSQQLATSCRFATADSLQRPRLIAVNATKATLVYDIRRAVTPVVELGLPDPDVAGSHKASWLVATDSLVGRTTSDGAAVVWDFKAPGTATGIRPLLTMRPPTLGGLSIPTFLADCDEESWLHGPPKALAILEVPGELSRDSVGLAFWPICI